MKIDWKTNLYGLIGNPITKSLSPKIHNYFFEINNINSVYLAFNVKEIDLENVVKSFKAINIKGFNVTIPHKIKIIDYMDEMTEEAKNLGAVNTVRNINGKLIGDNTDGKGFVKSLKEEKVKLKNKNVLIIGSGGAAHAISFSLAMNGVKQINILNRNKDKAVTLKEKIENKFKKLVVKCDSIENHNLYVYDTDIVINCTPLGMYPETGRVPIDIELFNEETTICDIVYKPLKTKLLREAENNKLKTVNGLGMLVNQAIISQEVWGNIHENNVEKNVHQIKGFLLKK